MHELISLLTTKKHAVKKKSLLKMLLENPDNFIFNMAVKDGVIVVTIKRNQESE